MAKIISNIFNKLTVKQCEVAVLVTTGDKKGAGTDANVWITLHDDRQNTTPKLKLNRPFYNDHERGKTDEFPVPDVKDFGNVVMIEFGRDNFGVGDAWFVDKIAVRNGNDVFEFPIQRWIEAHRVYKIRLHDCILPQSEEFLKQRQEELNKKKQIYRYRQVIPEGPAQIAELPEDEKFHEDYYLDFAKQKMKLLARAKGINMITGTWDSISDLKNTYKKSKSLGEPKSMDHWMSDYWFGLQRVQGVNPVLITLCKQIPDKFGVTSQMVEPHLQGLSLEEAIESNRIFIIDLEIMEGIYHHEKRPLVEPLALFFRNNQDNLMPVAIQLHQQKGPDNPVFLPSDPFHTWVLAKMWYNLADAQHHQCITHLGLTHLLMEGVCVCTHRTLSPSHPLFRLLAPHFLYLLAINSRGLEKLVAPGAWVDKCMTVQRTGMFQLITKALNDYRMDKYGMIKNEIRSRGVLSKEVLPHYPYRDDAVQLYDIIHKYVNTIIRHYYNHDEKLLQDDEVKSWRKELSADRNELEGVGLQGVPGNDDTGFATVNELVDTVTVIIVTCSVGHAAANFQQYEAYGFVPNFPGMLVSNPPTDKRVRTEADILAALPDKKTTLDIMVITKLLSLQGTNTLGDFEVQYMYDEVSIKAKIQMKNQLEELRQKIEERNKDAHIPYKYLDPINYVPNAISI